MTSGARTAEDATAPTSFRAAAEELASIYDEWKRLERRAEYLKNYLRERYAGESDLVRVGPSLYLDLPEAGKSVRVTEGEPTETLNPDRFRALVADDALFLRLVRVTAAELDVPAWLEQVEAERFRETDLLDCVDTRERAPAVGVARLRRVRTED